jgi:threonine/homoserine/homoserine lactone efflux protein
LFLAWLIGLAFGFLGSMPIAGPTAVVLVSKGLDNQFRAGIYIAAGAAAAESAYAFMAFWGLTAVLHRYPVLVPGSRLVGAILLALLGCYFVVRKSKDAEAKRDEAQRSALRSLLTGFSLTALNPMLIVTWTAAVGAAHSTGVLRVDALDAFPFAGGAACGIVGWFAVLLWLLSHFHSRVKPTTIDRIIRWMGVLLILVGIGLTVRAIAKWHDTSDLDTAKSGGS